MSIKKTKKQLRFLTLLTLFLEPTEVPLLPFELYEDYYYSSSDAEKADVITTPSSKTDANTSTLTTIATTAKDSNPRTLETTTSRLPTFKSNIPTTAASLATGNEKQEEAKSFFETSGTKTVDGFVVPSWFGNLKERYERSVTDFDRRPRTAAVFQDEGDNSDNFADLNYIYPNFLSLKYKVKID